MAAPLSNVDKITMYGEGNSANLVGDIVKSTTQASEGLLSGLGIDLKSALSGFIGGKAATPSVCQSSAAPVADSSDAE